MLVSMNAPRADASPLRCFIGLSVLDDMPEAFCYERRAFSAMFSYFFCASFSFDFDQLGERVCL